MALTTYAELQTAILKWLDREDDTDMATNVVPDLITLCEAEIRRRLRKTSIKDELDIDDVEVDLPSDLAVLRSIRLITDSPDLDKPLRRCTPEMLNERKAREGSTGRPSDFAIINGKLYVAPEPDDDYTAEIIYFDKLESLSTSNTTNSVLDDFPDVYLFGALLQAEPYLEHDERIPTWKAKFDAAIDQLNAQRQEEEDTASLGTVRLPYGGFSG